MTAADLRKALPRFEQFIERFGPLLGDDSRPDRAQAYLRGLLLDAEDNKTAEAIALKVHGDPSQVRMTQVFISQSPWLDEPLRQELVRWVNEDLGADDGILVVDESSFLKCGNKSVGVARQYLGSEGKIANGQVAVYLSYASSRGHTLLDTRLYLPEEWARDPQRRAEAGVPPEVVFRTKPELGLELVRQHRAVLRHRWITFDEAYGRNPGFLRGLEELGERYIGEVPKDTRGWRQRPVVEPPRVGRKGRPALKARVAAGEPAPQTVETVAAALPASAWQRRKIRDGSKGEQWAEFARVRFVVERDDWKRSTGPLYSPVSQWRDTGGLSESKSNNICRKYRQDFCQGIVWGVREVPGSRNRPCAGSPMLRIGVLENLDRVGAMCHETVAFPSRPLRWVAIANCKKVLLVEK